MKTVAFVLPYFVGNGHFPDYFQSFLNSCSDNPTIDFLIVTDDAFDYAYAFNIHVIKCSFEAFKERVRKTYDFDLALDRPYKLCDFKPAYGEIMAEELKGYDYWGHCDCDMIWGDIRSFLTPEVLTHDKIFSRGHCTIFRNDPEVNALYRQLDYKTVFSNPKSFSFDEWGNRKYSVSELWRLSGRPFYDEMVMDDIIVGWEGFHLTKAYLAAYHENNKNRTREFHSMKFIYYEHKEGELIRHYFQKGVHKTEPVLYAHFQKRMIEPLDAPEAHDFLIVPDRILAHQELSDSQIKKLLSGSETYKVKLREIKMRLVWIILILQGNLHLSKGI